MEEQVVQIKKRVEQINQILEDPATIKDQKRYVALCKELKEKEEIVACHTRCMQNEAQLIEAKEMLKKSSDAEMKAFIQEEIQTLQAAGSALQEELRELLLPKDPNDDKNAILEVRAGTGGDEAALWAGDLFRMYQRYADQKKWKVAVLDYTEGSSGGYKEIVATIKGAHAYGMLKYESGVHRVQRVPHTETQGRIHTSAASIVILPEMDDVDVDIDMNDVRKDTFCSSGPGGQSVNTTYSAVRLTHLPTGITASCQDGKSQIKNFEKALQVLRARLYERALRERESTVGDQRRSMVGSGDRSDKIRTYNYPQSRVTDHRSKYTIHNLVDTLNGNIEALIEAMQLHVRTEQLRVMSQSEK